MFVLPSRFVTPQRLLWASAVAAVITITLKTTAWAITGSVGLLSDAMESFVNLASAIFALVMVTIAQRPADAEHPYGHHKAEYFSSGFEGILIIGAAGGILWAAGHRLLDPQPITSLGWGLVLSVASSVISAGFSSAGELREILSAPLCRICRAPASERMPPATQKGMSRTRATRVTQSVETVRPSLLAVMS